MMQKTVSNLLIAIIAIVIVFTIVFIVILPKNDDEQDEKIELIGYVERVISKISVLSNFQLSNISTIGDYEGKSLWINSSINLTKYENKKVRIIGKIIEVKYPMDFEHPYQIMGTTQTYIVVDSIDFFR